MDIKSKKILVLMCVLCILVVCGLSCLNVFAAEVNYGLTIHVTNERDWENTNMYWWFENYEEMGTIKSEGYFIDSGYIKENTWFINAVKDENNSGWYKIDCSFSKSDIIGINFIPSNKNDVRTEDIEWDDYNGSDELWVTITNDYTARARTRLNISTEKPANWNDK